MSELIEREAAVEAVFQTIRGFWHPNASEVAARQVAEAALRDVPASTRYAELERAAAEGARALRKAVSTISAMGEYCHGLVEATLAIEKALANLDAGGGRE